MSLLATSFSVHRPTVGLTGAYVVGAVIARWLLIGVPAAAHFEQQWRRLFVRCRRDDDATALGMLHQAAALARRSDLINPARNPRAGDGVQATTHNNFQWRAFCPGLWRHISAWRILHEVERNLVESFTPAELTVELRSLAPRRRVPHGVDARKALLVHQLRRVHRRRDAQYDLAASVHRRSFFLLLVLALLIPVAAVAWATPVVLLLGATGGALSRAIWIARSESPVPSDYGLRWSALLLAPMIGALSAGAGMLLVSGAAALGVTGPQTASVCTDIGWSADACTPPSTTSPSQDHEVCDCEPPASSVPKKRDDQAVPATSVSPKLHADASKGVAAIMGLSPLAACLAFLFGFSEKLFNRWIERVEANFDPDKLGPTSQGAAADGSGGDDEEGDGAGPTPTVGPVGTDLDDGVVRMETTEVVTQANGDTVTTHCLVERTAAGVAKKPAPEQPGPDDVDAVSNTASEAS